MADNLFAMLQKAQESASTADSKMFGVEIGIVTNVQDADQLGRVKVVKNGKLDEDLAMAMVWNTPSWADGSLRLLADGLKFTTADNTTRMIQTKSGHQIILDDKKGAEKIVIADKSGNRTMTFDVKNKKFLIEAKEGDVEIHAEKKIILECEDLEIKTKKTGKIDIGSTFDLNVKDKANIKAGPQLNIKASRVNIN